MTVLEDHVTYRTEPHDVARHLNSIDLSNKHTGCCLFELVCFSVYMRVFVNQIRKIMKLESLSNAHLFVIY